MTVKWLLVDFTFWISVVQVILEHISLNLWMKTNYKIYDRSVCSEWTSVTMKNLHALGGVLSEGHGVGVWVQEVL